MFWLEKNYINCSKLLNKYVQLNLENAKQCTAELLASEAIRFVDTLAEQHACCLLPGLLVPGLKLQNLHETRNKKPTTTPLTINRPTNFSG